MSKKKTPNLKFEKLNRVRRDQYVTAAQSLTDLVLSGLPKERRKAIVSEVAAGAADFEVLVRFGVRGEAVVVTVKRAGQELEVLDRLVSLPDETAAAKAWLN